MGLLRLKHVLTTLLIVGVGQSHSGFSQVLSNSDSLPLSKPRLKEAYGFNHPLEEITLVNREPTPLEKLPKNTGQNLTDGMITLLTGLGTSSTTEGWWSSMNELKPAKGNEWRIPLTFQGVLEKSRERVKSDDGSYSVETSRGVRVDWRKGAAGFILEQNDTVGAFSLTIHSGSDDLNNWLTRIEEESGSVQSLLYKLNPGYHPSDKFVIGRLGKRDFAIVTCGSGLRSVVLLDDKPVAILQASPDFIILGKKNKIHPYLLLGLEMEQEIQSNVVRLAMLSRLLDRCVNQSYYEK